MSAPLSAVPRKRGVARLVSWSVLVPALPLPVSELAASLPDGTVSATVSTAKDKVLLALLSLPKLSLNRAPLTLTRAAVVVLAAAFKPMV